MSLKRTRFEVECEPSVLFGVQSASLLEELVAAHCTCHCRRSAQMVTTPSYHTSICRYRRLVSERLVHDGWDLFRARTR